MEASGDKGMGRGGGAATGSGAAGDNSEGVEHDANRKLSTKAERRGMDFPDWFISGDMREA